MNASNETTLHTLAARVERLTGPDRVCPGCREPTGGGPCDMCAAYQPPHTGIHVCGVDDISDWPVTLASFPMSEDLARMTFNRMREYEDADHDVVVDLFICGDQPDNFGIKRQMLDRVTAAALRARAEGGDRG